MADQNRGRQLFTPRRQPITSRVIRSFFEHFYAALNTLQHNISYYFFELDLPAAIFPNETFVFTMAVIPALLQLKYQPEDSKNPFESHPILSALAITSFLLYGLAYSIEHRFSSNPRYSLRLRNIVRCGMLLTGCFCLASTASFMFPHTVSPLIFVFYFIRFAAEMLYWVYQRFHQERRTFNEVWGRIRGIFTGIWRLSGQCFTVMGFGLHRLAGVRVDPVESSRVMEYTKNVISNNIATFEDQKTCKNANQKLMSL